MGSGLDWTAINIMASDFLADFWPYIAFFGAFALVTAIFSHNSTNYYDGRQESGGGPLTDGGRQRVQSGGQLLSGHLAKIVRSKKEERLAWESQYMAERMGGENKYLSEQAANAHMRRRKEIQGEIKGYRKEARAATKKARAEKRKGLTPFF